MSNRDLKKREKETKVNIKFKCKYNVYIEFCFIIPYYYNFGQSLDLNLLF